MIVDKVYPFCLEANTVFEFAVAGFIMTRLLVGTIAARMVFTTSMKTVNMFPWIMKRTPAEKILLLRLKFW